MKHSSGDSIEAMRSLFQTGEGGAIPTSPLHLKELKIYPAKWSEVKHIFADFHYRKEQMGGSLKFVFKVEAQGIIVGGLAFGNPWHPQTYSEDGTHKCIELRRLCFIDASPKNSESWSIGYCLRWLKKYTDYTRILSYSDLGEGHNGTIYRASGFKLYGETEGGQVILWKGKRYHVRSLSIERSYAKELNHAIAKGEAEIIMTGVKRLWIKDINKPRKNAIVGYFQNKQQEDNQMKMFEDVGGTN